MKVPNRRLVRMLEKISSFNTEIKYIPGEQNRCADFLSRHHSKTQEAPCFPRQRAAVRIRSAKAGAVTHEDAASGRWQKRARSAKNNNSW